MEISTVVSLCILVGSIALAIGFLWGRRISLAYLWRAALLRCGLVKPTEAEIFRRNFNSRARQPIPRPPITPEMQERLESILIDPKTWRE